jgi:hypothetical protein
MDRSLRSAVLAARASGGARWCTCGLPPAKPPFRRAAIPREMVMKRLAAT